MRNGRELIGYGMATGIWEALRVPTTAEVELAPDGKLIVSTAAADIGTGTYTILAQIGGEMLGLPLDQVEIRIGDSELAAMPCRRRLMDGGVGRLGGYAGLRGRSPADPQTCATDQEFAAEGRRTSRHRIRRRRNQDTVRSSARVPLKDVLREINEAIKSKVTSMPDPAVEKRFAHNTHSAVFAEVRLDEELGMLRVTRVVNAVAAGRILNPKTAGSQIMGAVVGGIGMALHEEAVIDHRYGRIINHNFAEYHVPVNADVHDIEVIFVDEREDYLNPLGIKGVGEIGIVGTAAAIANAVFHATGVRVRDLPITIDKILGLRKGTDL